MNNTNRALNRTLLIVTGLIALLVGATLVAVGMVPAVRASYESMAPAIHRGVMGWMETLPLFDTGSSWAWVFVLLLLVLIVFLLLILIFRQGQGQEQTLVQENPTQAGTTIIDSAVAEQMIKDALDDQPEFISTSVSTYLVRGTPVLKVSVTCHRGVSPRQVTNMIENRLTSFDAFFGRKVPALIEISGGFRVRISRTTRTE